MIGVIDEASQDVEARCIWRHEGSWTHTGVAGVEDGIAILHTS